MERKLIRISTKKKNTKIRWEKSQLTNSTEKNKKRKYIKEEKEINEEKERKRGVFLLSNYIRGSLPVI